MLCAVAGVLPNILPVAVPLNRLVLGVAVPVIVGFEAPNVRPVVPGAPNVGGFEMEAPNGGGFVVGVPNAGGFVVGVLNILAVVFVVGVLKDKPGVAVFVVAPKLKPAEGLVEPNANEPVEADMVKQNKLEYVASVGSGFTTLTSSKSSTHYNTI